MKVRNAFFNILMRKHKILTRFSILSFFIFTAVSLKPDEVFSQVPEYDEISVFLNVHRVGGGEFDAVIIREKLYLPVTDLFDFLKIRNIPDPDLKSISGFFINPQATYTINRAENKIIYQGKTYDLEPNDIIRTENNLYLLSSYFGKVFGLECKFDFRSLSVVVDSKLELPLIKEMKQEEMRKNLKRLKGETKADTTIGRSYPGFKFGMADWSINSSQEIGGVSSTQLNLGLGAMVAGGEATTSLYYDTQSKFNWKYQQYLWRYVNNDFSPLRQVSVGKISTNAISTLYNPVVGINLTNTPTTYRRSFGSYTLSDRTEPDWIVELYVNNVLVDYVKADASGFFTFEVPLVYGNTIVNLKFIGPWGEERTREQNINIPFTFLPVNTLEYSINAGIVLDSSYSKFSRASVNYGLFKSMTIGGGAEYLSSVSSGPAMPYLNTSIKITNNLLLTSEYTYGVRSKSTMTYRLPSNMQFDINYTWYDKDQTAIKYNYREERKATLSMPLKIGKLSTYQRFSYNQIILPVSKYTTGEWLLSGSLFNVGTNLTTYALFVPETSPSIYSILALSFRLPAGIVCMPQVQYGYTQGMLLSSRIELQKHLLRNAFIDISYEHNNVINIDLAQLQFRYDFSFAQAGFTVARSNKKTILYQYARGSLISDRKTKYLGTDNRTNVGKGGIAIVAFMDLNSNGKRDPGERKAYGLNLHVNGGRVENSDRDSTIRILGLEPYTNCFIELDPNSFENISWRLPFKTLNVSVDPDILKYIEIPVTVVGEASGNVSLVKDGEKSGQKRMIVNIYSASSRLAGRALSEEDGYYSYFGLAPGNYTVRVDTNQLKKLGMSSDPVAIPFSIREGLEGDVVDGLDFLLQMTQPDTTGKKAPVITQKPLVRKDTTYMIVHEVSQELVTITEDSYAIQVGAFKNKSNAETLRRKLENLLGRKVEIVIEDNYYKVRINEIKDRKEVDSIIEVLKKNGINELWLISLKAKKQQWVVTAKQDTVSTVTETITQNPSVIDSDILLGTFRLRSNTIELKKLVSASLDKKLTVSNIGGFYKVNVAGNPKLDETVLEEMKKLEPSIREVKFKDFHIIPIIQLPEEETGIIVREIPPRLSQQVIEIPSLEKQEMISGFIKSKIADQVISPVPTISLQVGVFHKKSDALRAQRRIISKLNLKAEIVQLYDFYHVIIPGFFTREETYKYYPELAGLGYPGPTIIENK
jgi:hypothetical protein